MADCCGCDIDAQALQQRRVLRTGLIINDATFVMMAAAAISA